MYTYKKKHNLCQNKTLLEHLIIISRTKHNILITLSQGIYNCWEWMVGEVWLLEINNN